MIVALTRIVLVGLPLVLAVSAFGQQAAVLPSSGVGEQPFYSSDSQVFSILNGGNPADFTGSINFTNAYLGYGNTWLAAAAPVGSTRTDSYNMKPGATVSSVLSYNNSVDYDSTTGNVTTTVLPTSVGLGEVNGLYFNPMAASATFATSFLVSGVSDGADTLELRTGNAGFSPDIFFPGPVNPEVEIIVPGQRVIGTSPGMIDLVSYNHSWTLYSYESYPGSDGVTYMTFTSNSTNSNLDLDMKITSPVPTPSVNAAFLSGFCVFGFGLLRKKRATA